MAKKPSLEILFTEWNELNTKAQASLGEFDFAKIKEIRAEQKQREDAIYEVVKEKGLV